MINALSVGLDYRHSADQTLICFLQRRRRLNSTLQYALMTVSKQVQLYPYILVDKVKRTTKF